MSTVERLSPLTGESDSKSVLRSVGAVFFILLGGYGAVTGTQAMRAFLQLTFDFGMSRAGVWLFIETYFRQAPVFTLFLIGIAGVAAYRNKGLFVSMLLPMALLLGMGFALFGFPPKWMSFFEPAIPVESSSASLGGALAWVEDIWKIELTDSQTMISM